MVRTEAYQGTTKVLRNLNRRRRGRAQTEAYVNGELVTAMSWSVKGGKIQEIYALRNPDKVVHPTLKSQQRPARGPEPTRRPTYRNPPPGLTA